MSRQHPRDLFDIGLLLDDERLGETLWHTFLVYLTCSPKPAWEMLAPREPVDFDTIFDAHFKGMTAEPVTAAQLLETRTRLLSWISDRLDEASCAFLWSVEDEDPDLGLIGLERAAALPRIGRKLQNLARRSQVKRRADRLQMAQMLKLREARLASVPTRAKASSATSSATRVHSCVQVRNVDLNPGAMPRGAYRRPGLTAWWPASYA